MPGDAVDGSTPSPTEAFSRLANDQRMAIMETLWHERDPMSFTALRESVGIADSGQFNYHLGKLDGLYVRETDEGYELTRPGRRVLTAVLAGDLLDRPEVGPTRLDWPCPRCDADVELRYDDEMLRVLCTACPGLFEGEAQTSRERRENPRGTISILPIPPAGVEGRTPEELLAAAFQWISHQATMMSSGMCSECSGRVDVAVHVCPDHEPGDGLCASCGSRYAAVADLTCEVCGDGITALMGAMVWKHPSVRTFFADYGYNLMTADPPSVRASVTYDEVVHSIEPLDYELRWTFGDEWLRVRVDGNLDVKEIERSAA